MANSLRGKEVQDFSEHHFMQEKNCPVPNLMPGYANNREEGDDVTEQDTLETLEDFEEEKIKCFKCSYSANIQDRFCGVCGSKLLSNEGIRVVASNEQQSMNVSMSDENILVHGVLEDQYSTSPCSAEWSRLSDYRPNENDKWLVYRFPKDVNKHTTLGDCFLTNVSPSFAEMLGREVSELTGSSFSAILSEELSEQYKKMTRHAFSLFQHFGEHVNVRATNVYKHKDGGLVGVATDSFVFLGANKIPVYSFSNITNSWRIQNSEEIQKIFSSSGMEMLDKQE